MTIYQAKRLAKKLGIVLACIAGFCAVVAGITSLIEKDREADQRALCAPDGMVQTFYYDHHYHAVCLRSDGTMFVSAKSK